MLHAREDYNRLQDPHGRIPFDEPVFLIRGQDPFAEATLEFYAAQCRAAGVNDIADKVTAQIERIKNWPVKKTPDL